MSIVKRIFNQSGLEAGPPSDPPVRFLKGDLHKNLQLGGMVVLMAVQHVVGQRLPLLRTGAMERVPQPRLDAEVQQVFASLGEEYHELCERLFADDTEFGLRFSEDLAPR